MAVGDGRNQVVPDTPIASQWGNSIADRTVQSYDSVADRDNRWVAPQPGSVCYTVVEDEFWIRVAGVWKLLPYGYLTHADGPPATKTVHTAYEPLVTVNFAAKTGRVYQFTGHAAGTQVLKGGSGYSRLQISTAWGTQHWCAVNDPLLGDVLSFDLSIYARSNNTGNAYASLFAMTTVAGGGVQFGSNSAVIWVTDVGG